MHITLFKSLPDDIIDIIWNMLDDSVKSSLDKRYFFSYNFDNYSTMTLHNQYAYNRVMIRNDDSFIFNNIISNYGKKWILNKKFVDRNNQIHNNYLYFLISLIHENNSSKCDKIMMKFLDKEGLNKNLYKKYRIKNIRWSN